jgi:hypothetical protein
LQDRKPQRSKGMKGHFEREECRNTRNETESRGGKGREA